MTSAEGSNCTAGLLSISGTFYGTTESGGSFGYGTIFKVTSAGAFTVLLSIDGNDYPGEGSTYAALCVDHANNLFSLSSADGGGILETGTSGGIEDFYLLGTNYNEGLYPYDTLLLATGASNNTLYGVTSEGGSVLFTPNFATDGTDALGTVFSYSAGSLIVLHSFKG